MRSATRRSTVQWVDTDAAGIHHNTLVNRLVEAAEAQLVQHAGLDLGAYFPVTPRVRFEADYEAPLFFSQEVTTTLSVAAVGTSSLTYEFEIWGEAFDGHHRRRAAKGRYVVVHLDEADHGAGAASSPWPDEWLSALGDAD
ncbi:acyl-CoA thioesterase [Knoellia koreensis]|uniref:Acyl-CoA thioesterase n=1 Tax=Knoellia koreensis TaxID=2730921 RepID=A0A849HKG0_9MICO|nr:thioesterase family protein [Knoellia sp. DB2414S]NNM47153.1 acyl-CoA thioesterase [Knoellia sp. DB2414S]